MGDSKHNIKSLLRETLPKFPPLNRDVQPGMAFRALPKRCVFLVQPGEETDPQELAAHAAYCQQVGVEQVIHQLGEPLGQELCDVVLLLIAGWFDTAAPQPTAGQMTLPGEVLRLDMKEFIENAEKTIGGGSRIIQQPTLVY